MRAVLYVVLEALSLYKWVVIIAAILSWLIAFNVVNIRNEVVRSVNIARSGGSKEVVTVEVRNPPDRSQAY